MFYRFHLEIISNLQKRNKNSTNTIPIHLNQIKLLLTFCPIYVTILILSIFAAGSQSSLLPQLFISIICLDSQVSVLFCFFYWFIIHYCPYLFGAQIVPDLASVSSSGLAPGSFGHGTIIPYFLPSSEISHFSRKPWFLLVRNDIMDEDLGALVATGIFQWKKLRNICMYRCVYTHTYLHTYTYPCAHMPTYTYTFILPPSHRLFFVSSIPYLSLPSSTVRTLPPNNTFLNNTSPIDHQRLFQNCFPLPTPKNKLKNLVFLGSPLAPVTFPKTEA